MLDAYLSQGRRCRASETTTTVVVIAVGLGQFFLASVNVTVLIQFQSFNCSDVNQTLMQRPGNLLVAGGLNKWIIPPKCCLLHLLIQFLQLFGPQMLVLEEIKHLYALLLIIKIRNIQINYCFWGLIF